MQQTNKYKLNLIEKDDAFSPDPLNENARKVEAALDAKASAAGAKAAKAALEAADAALDRRVTAIEAHHIYVGSYVGTGAEQFVDLGFTPAAVLICTYPGRNIFMLTEEKPDLAYGSTVMYFLYIVEGGFRTANGSPYGDWSTKGTRYYFIALA